SSIHSILTTITIGRKAQYNSKIQKTAAICSSMIFLQKKRWIIPQTAFLKVRTRFQIKPDSMSAQSTAFIWLKAVPAERGNRTASRLYTEVFQIWESSSGTLSSDSI